MAEPRLLCFHRKAEAQKWQTALDEAGLSAKCIVYEEPFLDGKYGWQPPRWKWFDYESDCGTKHVYVIDAEWEITNVQATFVSAGNHHAYPSNIPPDCIYVEASNAETQYGPRISAENHEVPEDCRMESDPDITYEEAHGYALAKERQARKSHRDQRVIDEPGKRENEAKEN